MANYVNAMQQLYVAYYNRPADPAGLEFWTGVVEASGGNTAAVSSAFASSQEYIDAYGGKDNRTVVNTVYRNLFGRDCEKAGVAGLQGGVGCRRGDGHCRRRPRRRPGGL